MQLKQKPRSKHGVKRIIFGVKLVFYFDMKGFGCLYILIINIFKQ